MELADTPTCTDGLDRSAQGDGQGKSEEELSSKSDRTGTVGLWEEPSFLCNRVLSAYYLLLV